ncbi:MAG TPA: ABC transporter ATP-binding protein [Jiangellales bacterium]|nr:ABC transporter ATP-binding protein [Jiangellales bacterium]
MRTLPYADPGVPDTRSPARFLRWIAGEQAGALALGMMLGIAWMLAQALVPWAIGNGINEIADGDTTSAWQWAGVVAALGLTQAVVGVVRHRVAVANWLYAAFRTIQLVARHTARTGPAVPKAMPTGEVVATVSSDAMHIGHVFETSLRFAGAIASYVVVSFIVLNTSAVLGLIVLIGVPVLVLALVPIVRPLQRRQRAQREALGELTSLGADTVVGLRVLRGIGGEQVFAQRYRQRSETVRVAGVRLATTFSYLDAALVLLPGVFLVVLTWVGSRLVVDGAVAPGDLVALYGFAFFLLIPVRTAGEMTFIVTRAVIAARRVLKVLTVEREVAEAAATPASPIFSGDEAVGDGVVLTDATSGLAINAGELTILVSDRPSETAAIADRLGRLVPENGVRLRGTPLDDLPLAEVRRHIVVSDPEPMLFTGTLRGALDPAGRHTDTELLAALSTVAAGDVLESLRDGLDGGIDERARSLSGGQRQRVALARVLLRQPEILVLVEPTSAVDAHSEAAIAANLRDVRAGRTTVVVTASPLLLGHADTVAWVVDGTVAAVGRHDELMSTVPEYRRTVTREEEEAA